MQSTDKRNDLNVLAMSAQGCNFNTQGFGVWGRCGRTYFFGIGISGLRICEVRAFDLAHFAHNRHVDLFDSAQNTLL